jgi:hypothetical protein
VSRIWDALKEAEHQRSRRGGVDGGERADAAKSGDRRSSARSVHRVPLLVYGSDCDKQPFHEEIYTTEVSDNGCMFSLEAVVARGQRLILTNMRNQEEQECRVVHVGRRIQSRSKIGVEFLKRVPGFWERLYEGK